MAPGRQGLKRSVQMTGNNWHGRARHQHAQAGFEWAHPSIAASRPFRKEDKDARVLGETIAISSAHFFHSSNGILPFGRRIVG